MNNDYLWDKTGADAEIERIENALQTFRCEPKLTFPLRVEIAPAPQNDFSRKFSRRKIAFALAAACLLFAVVAVGVVRQNSRDDATAKQNPTQQVEPRAEVATAELESPTIPNAAQSPNKNVETARNAAPQTKRKTPVRRVVPAAFDKTVAANRSINKQNSHVAQNPAPLSAEEQRAYDQLMLALSITGEKLKIVKDKVDGLE